MIDIKEDEKKNQNKAESLLQMESVSWKNNNLNLGDEKIVVETQIKLTSPVKRTQSSPRKQIDLIDSVFYKPSFEIISKDDSLSSWSFSESISSSSKKSNSKFTIMVE
jgi:hypothetical protein